ncbi:TCP-1/cpn60 chaperonin family protein [Candidatus Bathyarchaeota archaeon]|nr:TCP-1/cpn60 chaperonin family protein [Candidatus Bathyarchaeota archaeon]
MAYLTTQGGQPILVLKEGTGRTRKKEAQKGNITAARAVAEVLRTTLGPRGMDKMLISGLGDITITNDGASILKDMDIEHPAAKMMVEISKTQDDMVGDGTTTVVVLGGELLKKAEELLDQDVHPTSIVSGYRKAAAMAIKILNEISEEVDPNDSEILRKIAETSMSSKAVGYEKGHLAEIVLEAVKQITEQRGDKKIADIDQVQIVKKVGKSLFDTNLIKGVIVEKEVAHARMPKRIENAKICLVNAALEVEKTEFSAEIRIKDPTQVKAFMDQETQMLSKMIAKIKKSGANVVFCQKGIDDVAQHFLAKEGILAATRVKESDMEKLARAAKAKVVVNLDDLRPEDLGEAGLVEERKIANDKMIFVEGCKDPRSVAIFVRAGLERMVDEAERALKDALSVVRNVVEHNKIVAGGGAVEAEIARQLRDYVPKVSGREQLAVNAFAESLEVVPWTLAENAGLEPIDIISELRASHEKPKGTTIGVDVFSGKVVDMRKKGVIEPAIVKEHAIKSASETACMILRIDDIIAASKPKVPEGMPPSGMPPGGMPGAY